MQLSVLMQSLWCCQQILTKPVAQVHVYLTEGTLALREGTEVHIDVLPLGVLLVCQFLEVGKEIAFHLSTTILTFGRYLMAVGVCTEC